MARILVTNGGAHPPEKWAMTTAEQIFDVATSVAGDRLIQAQKLQLAIAEALMPYHEKVQSDERKMLADQVDNMHLPHCIEEYLDDVMKAVVAAAKGTEWAAHFAKEEVQAAAREIIGAHFATVQHVERLWYADRNPDCEVSQAYRAKFA